MWSRLTDVQARWAAIDTTGSGVITKHDASSFIAQKEVNPLNMAFHYIKENFQLANSVDSSRVILVAVAIFKAIWLFASRYTTQLLAIRVSRDLRQQYFEHIQLLPMSFYQQHNIGSLSSRVVGDAGQIASSINSGITNYLQTPFTVITSLIDVFLSFLETLLGDLFWDAVHRDPDCLFGQTGQTRLAPASDQSRALRLRPHRLSCRHPDRENLCDGALFPQKIYRTE